MKPFMSISILTLLVVNLCLSGYTLHRTPRIAYVRSKDLVYGYFGMKEAMSAFQNKQAQWRAELDTLQADYQRSIEAMNEANLSTEIQAARKAVALKRRNDLAEHDAALQAKAKEEEDKMLEAVLGQINSFITTYAKEHDLDVVLGTTDSGNLLFSEDGTDITNDLLTALNLDQQGGTK